MTPIISREISLASRPSGYPTAANFELAQTEMEPRKDGQCRGELIVEICSTTGLALQPDLFTVA